KHWWSPERRGPPEGVPHRPHGTLVVAEATWATRRRSSQATMEHWWSPERHGPPEGVPHRPLWNIGGRRSDKLALPYLKLT
ncbi:hypothetical protein R9U51_02710, partial [Escherichia coli]